MPAERYPGAVWMPGRNAGYHAGRTAMLATFAHYTVGYDSTGIGLDGYFNFLVSRDGTVEQYAEVSALTWHAGEANGDGPGIELEFLDEPTMFTEQSLDSCGALVNWIAREWGVPLRWYDTGGNDSARLFPGAWNGYRTHRSVVQSAQHYDYWTQEAWDAMTRPAPAPVPEPIEEVDDVVVIYQAQGLDPSQANRLWNDGVNIANDVTVHLRLQGLGVKPGTGVVDLGTVPKWVHDAIADQCAAARGETVSRSSDDDR